MALLLLLDRRLYAIITITSKSAFYYSAITISNSNTAITISNSLTTLVSIHPSLIIQSCTQAFIFQFILHIHDHCMKQWSISIPRVSGELEGN